MESCEVLIVGGGPAGSSCAWRLQQSGIDVVVMDRAEFPRDKVCAGWITPQLVDALQLDLADYARHRTLQIISGFRVGLIGRGRPVEVAYDRPVSFGIRRCEFDEYLLTRSRAKRRLGTRVTSIRRSGGEWIVNESIKAALLVGAGGHFCPVARMLNPSIERGPLIAAQEIEFPIDARDGARFPTSGELPELYFAADLKGYGWCFRKGAHLNVGLGRLDPSGCARATRELIAFLTARKRLPPDATWRWRGHAYLLSEPRARRVFGDGVMLLGDAAGLAYPQSGEGIRPAVESGLLAAATIVEARKSFSADRLRSYEAQLRTRLGARAFSTDQAAPTASPLTLKAGRILLGIPWFVRRVVLDRWFLRTAEPALAH
jgi:flavin-dependent dehydrogenase